MAAALLLYTGYFLLGGGLQGERMPYDAGHYWELAVNFQHRHQYFSLLRFQDATRGYLSALIHFPALAVRFLTQCSMPTAAKVMGIGWATLLFAVLIPALWHSTTQQRVSGGRWLLLLLLSFAFWRDHFSFTTVDMPALAMLLLGLWALSRRQPAWWWVAGLSLAAASNTRPMYVAAVPAALALAMWWSHRHAGSSYRRGLALLMGGCVALGPQLLINQRHFQSSSPFVLVQVSGQDRVPVYLKQLTWGTRAMRYDTNLQQRLVYADPAGLAVLRQEQIVGYSSYAQFFGIVLRHPLNFSTRYLWHLFNGLDVQQPAPYLIREYGSERPWVQLLNYTALGVGGLVLLTGLRCFLQDPTVWALLLSCVAGIPTAIECRYLLPLHLLLLTLAAFGFSPAAWADRLCGRRGQALAVVLATVLWLGGCFWVSAATFRNLQPDHGKSLVDD
ncbi:hypothetical protein [Hymenobacter yonginensis]|uniref:Glycosyltransferase RgtA/B/C/D-like domain-containing protein n=1 Tax=Hymenobacter yonginensis TaxID=748197 RepID=A0ABY7PS29_9BACT|nr:hypothetical protein [Hymenobacter yonginensis]WBO85686.1 hypothetical protein O9Z63_05420 [Hymenobacter yonginensis]